MTATVRHRQVPPSRHTSRWAGISRSRGHRQRTPVLPSPRPAASVRVPRVAGGVRCHVPCWGGVCSPLDGGGLAVLTVGPLRVSRGRQRVGALWCAAETLPRLTMAQARHSHVPSACRGSARVTHATGRGTAACHRHAAPGWREPRPVSAPSAVHSPNRPRSGMWTLTPWRCTYDWPVFIPLALRSCPARWPAGQ